MIEKTMVIGRHPNLHWATASYDALAERLLNDGADPNVFDSGNTPLMHAVSLNNQRVIALLIQKGADINARAMNGSAEQPAAPLQVAVANGPAEMVYFLLELGADPNLTNWAGQSPQQFATQRGNLQILRVLNTPH
jgi:ankyrin repeat protein